MQNPLLFFIGSENSQVEIRSMSELRRWLEKERAKWDWLVRGSRVDVGNVASNVQAQWDDVFSNLRSYEDSGAPLEQTVRFMDRFTDSGPLLASESQQGSLVLDIYSSTGDVEAAAAYAFLKRHITLQHATSPELLRGILLTATPHLTDATELERRFKLERQNYKDALRSQTQKLQKAFDEQQSNFNKLLGRGKLVGMKVLKKRRDAFNRSAAEWRSSADSSVMEINLVRDTYRQFMGLRAPVDYWKGKSRFHRLKVRSSLRNLILFFIFFTIALAVAFIAAASFILHHPQTVTEGGKTTQTALALYVVISAGLAILSTLGFWIGRLLSRLYLSQHHLMTDAQERKVMTETYLALLESGAASDDERHIILGTYIPS